MNQISSDKRQEARALLVQANVYRFMAAVFAVAGLLVFIVLYFRNVDGNIIEAFRQPLLIGAMIIPFLPAIILSIKADKTRKKLMAILEKPGGDTPEKT